MLNFVDTTQEISFQDRNYTPDIGYGLEVSLKNAPIDFSYKSTETVDTFIAVKVDNQGNAIESINIETSLIDATGVYHNCDGLTDFATNLECGIYYFVVNNRYKSEHFQVFTELTEGSLLNKSISVSGIQFYDSLIDIDFQDRFAAPDYLYGIQSSKEDYPLDFVYLATGLVISFKIVNYHTGVETDLSTALISADGTYHECDGLTQYAETLPCGVYQYVVNDRYKSDLFTVFTSENSFLQLESGGFLPLESGGKIILE